MHQLYLILSGKLNGKKFFVLMIIVLFIPIIANYYKFFLTKDYYYLIEQSCDPKISICFYRNCEEEECPPNELENFRQFYVKAFDFAKCKDNSCAEECNSNLIQCEEVVCDTSIGDNCTDSTL